MSKGGFSDRLKKKSQNSVQEKSNSFATEKENFKEEDKSDNFEFNSSPKEEKQSEIEDQKTANSESSSENSKSFTDRFGKKNTFTSQKAEDKKPQKKNDLTDIANVDPKKRAQADLIYLVKGIDDGRNAWYYVLVDRPKVQLFLKALNDDIIHLENYGVILYSAYGDDPPQEITDAINKEYGIR